jgi:hypothetical protein
LELSEDTVDGAAWAAWARAGAIDAGVSSTSAATEAGNAIP